MTEILAFGHPAPQGSKRHVGNGRMIEQSKYVKPWRAAVVAAILAQCPRPYPYWGKPTALGVSMIFTLNAPQRVLKAEGLSHHSVHPDVDKLIRSTMDAVTESGLWQDDGQVASVSAVKSYPPGIFGAHPWALDSEGVRLLIAPLRRFPEGIDLS